MDIELKFPYSVDFNKVKEQILNSISSIENVSNDPPPRIGINTLEPDSYKLILNVWTTAHGYEDTRLALQEKLMNDFKNSELKLPGMEEKTI
jgi:small conductance mechanosensitive channel